MHALLTAAMFAAGVSASIASLTLYSDAACMHATQTISSPSTSLCYNSSVGDFIVLEDADPSRYWASTGYYDNAACSGTPVGYSAAIANECLQSDYSQAPSNAPFQIVRIRGTDFAAVYQWNCDGNLYPNPAQPQCLNCRNVTVLKENACARVNGQAYWTKPVVLGFGMGIFRLQFFNSTDGTCQRPAPVAESVPDSTCYGPRLMQATSLLRKVRPAP